MNQIVAFLRGPKLYEIVDGTCEEIDGCRVIGFAVKKLPKLALMLPTKEGFAHIAFSVESDEGGILAAAIPMAHQQVEHNRRSCHTGNLR